MTSPLGIGILGLGTVGSAVARAIDSRATRLDAMAGRPLRLIAVSKRDPGTIRDTATMDALSNSKVLVTSDPFALLDNPFVHIVVEVIGGTSPARENAEVVIKTAQRQKFLSIFFSPR